MAAPTKYTTAQKNAIAQAVLDHGMTVMDAKRAAEAGQLGIPAFPISREAAYRFRDLALANRAAAAAVASPSTSIPELASRLLAITAPQVAKLEQAAHGGKYKAQEIRDVTRNLAELRRLLHTAAPKANPKTDTGEGRRDGERGDLLNALQRQAQAAAQNTADPAPDVGTGQQPGSLQRTDATAALP